MRNKKICYPGIFQVDLSLEIMYTVVDFQWKN